MKKVKLMLGLSVAMILMVTLITGCDGDGNKRADVRVLHMSHDAPAVDVLVDDEIEFPNLVYPESSGYARINTRDGNRNIKVVPTGSDVNPVIDEDVTLDRRESYTVLAVNQLNNIEAIVVQDNREPNDGNAKVRFIHASPDAPAVDIREGSGTGPEVFSDVAFRDVTEYIEVDGGNYIFAVTPAGTSTEVFRYNPVTLDNGQVYTIVAHGTLADDDYPFAVRAFVDNNSGATFVDLADASVMAIHASPDAPAVDLLLDDELVAEGLEFPGNTGYLPLLSGDRNIKINAAGTSTTVIDANQMFETGGTHTSVFAFDELAGIRALVLNDDLSTPEDGFAHVRFVHLSPDAPAVDVAVAEGGPVLFTDVAFGEADDNGFFTPVASGVYDLEVRLAGEDAVVLSLPGISLEDGGIYTVFARGFASPAGGQPELGAEIITHE
jgi:hypothetical protein